MTGQAHKRMKLSLMGGTPPLGSGCSANEALDCQLDLHQIAVTPAIFIGADREDLQYE